MPALGGNYFLADDARNTLTWSNRVGNLQNVDICNFYSSGEEVLRENRNGAPPSEVGITANNVGYWIQDIYTDNHLPVGTYGFQWQEMLKGRGDSDTWVGSRHGGWSFAMNTNYWYVDHINGRRVPISAVPTRTSPILRHRQCPPPNCKPTPSLIFLMRLFKEIVSSKTLRIWLYLIPAAARMRKQTVTASCPMRSLRLRCRLGRIQFQHLMQFTGTLT